MGPFGPIFTARAWNSHQERVRVRGTGPLLGDWRGVDGSISPPTHVWWEDGIFMSHGGAVSPHAAAAIFAENGGVAR